MTHRRAIPWAQLFIEGVAIVVSILLAFWIDAWWDDRQALKQERELLLSLETEFTDLRERLDYWAGMNREGISLMERALSDAVSDMSENELDRAFAFAIRVNVLDQGGPLEGIINSGRLEQISDREIRARLAKWPDWLEDIHTNDLSFRDYSMREIMPYLARHGLPSRLCEPYAISCGPDTPAPASYLELVADPEFRAHLVSRHLLMGVAAVDHEQARDEADVILDLIAARVAEL